MTDPVIREAAASDLPFVVEMGREFLKSGPYRDQADNPEQAAIIAETVRNNGHILVSEDESGITGVFAFIVFPHYYTGELTAGEMIWYVRPEKRSGGIALHLLAMAEKISRAEGVKRMQLTAPSEEIGKLYKYCGGYRKMEVTYQRAL